MRFYVSVNREGYRGFPKNFFSAAMVCAPAGRATPQRAIRVIHGSVPVSKAPHLHAGPCGARMPALEIVQVHVVSQPPLQRARFQFSIVEILRFMAHHRFNRQLFVKTPGRDNSDCLSLKTIIHKS